LGNVSFNFASKKVSAKELENFTRLLSSLLAAGVPLSRALVILHKEASAPAAKAKWKEIHDLVVDGMSLANAMAKSPETFPRVYVAMVEAGEAGGFLDVVLAQIADFQTREKELKSKVMTAMIYPCILLFLALVVLTVLLVFFIPKFQKVFASVHGSLPLITQLVIGLSISCGRMVFLCVLGIVAIGFLVRAWFVSEKGKRMWEGIVLKSPLVGPLNAQFAMARFCRMLGTLLGAGVPLVQGLNVAPQIHRQPDSRGRRRPVHRARAAGRPARPKPGGLQNSFLRLGAGNDFGRGRKRQARRRTRARRRRHGI
jgi:type II secretory pathway component PulF